MNLKKIICLVMLFVATASGATLYAQGTLIVKGRVVDQQKQPVIGASVIENGTSNGVITGVDGDFSLKVSSENAVLQISFLGFEIREIEALSPLLSEPIVMAEDAQKVDEVVVIGYGTVRKNDMTGSVVAVKADDINRGAVTSPQQMMMGKIPGLHIVPGDGGPGSNSTIRIRGAASLNASNDPLIVIDGVPVANGEMAGMPNLLSSINPNDIESFTVLKDASATAIYGSRASNGVIIITTKKGKSKKLNVSYNSSYSVGVNTKQIDVLGTEDYRKYMLDFYPEGTNNGTTVRNLLGDASTDWQKMVFRPAFSTDQNISVYGRINEWLPYRASVGYTNEDGTIKTSNFERTTANISLSPSLLKDHLNININAKGVFNNNTFADGGIVNAAAFYDPTREVYFRDADGNIDYSRTNGWWNWYGADGKPNSMAMENPMSTLYDNYHNSSANRFLANMQVDYKFHFLPDLRVNMNIGMDRTSTTENRGTNPGSYRAIKDTDRPNLGKYEQMDNLRTNKLFEVYMAYNKEIGRNRFDLMGGYSWQHFYTENDKVSKVNTTDEVFFDELPFKTEYYLLSFFGRANYSYDGKYLFTATLRNDASSRFAKQNRWGLFPSAAVAWNVSQENWLKNNKTLTDLKFRASWGLTGQQDINQGDYPYMPRYTLHLSPSTSYPIDGDFVPVLQPNAYNENIKWETTETYNVGVDFGLWNGRLSGSLDAYYRTTRDLLNVVPVPLGANFSNAVISNIGNMRNKGVELSLNAVALRTSDWSWNVGMNATWQNTKITKLTATGDQEYGVGTGWISSGTGSTIQIHKVNNAPFSFYTYQQVYDRNGMPIQNTFVDRNGDGEITDSDRYISGKKSTPDFFFGLNSTVTYRNWDFGFNAHGSFGNWAFNDFYAGNSTPVGDFLTQGFLKNMSQTVFRSGFTEKNGNKQVYSDMFLEDASFFRMDNITLGYTFDKLAKSKMKLRTSFSVQNAFVITNYSGIDPENSGIDNNMWPRPRTFTLRLGLDF